jgi:bifunctional N-acetylglucosamine-1-phosphate-uridyltransferase/glucosamine-1-phosphate-acetyltransferase GlmU-like protein
MRRLLIVPAAGRGSRLQSSAPKALVPVAGRPMIDHLIRFCRLHVQHVVVVAHPSFAAAMRNHLARTCGDGPGCEIVEQTAPTGMLDAILLASPVVDRADPDRIWTLWCDQVGVLPDTLERLASAERDTAPAIVFPSVRQHTPYIHFQRDDSGRIVRVLQRREHDAMPDDGESDMGLFSLSRDAYSTALPEFARETVPGTGTSERNFLPFIPWLAARDMVTTIPCTDAREALGINTPDDLRAVESWLRERAVETA